MKNDEIRAVIRGIMSEVFEMGSGKLPDQADVDSISNWDSLAHLALIDSLEQSFKKSIPHDRAVELLSEDDIVAYFASMHD